VIGKHGDALTEMRVTVFTENLDPDHSKRPVSVSSDAVGRRGLVEARPSCPGIELVFGGK